MTLIRFELEFRSEIEAFFREWGRQQPRHPNQIGSPQLFSVTHPLGEVEFPDAFVNALERSGIPFERC